MSGLLADLGHKRYGAILADPPWRFEAWGVRGQGRSASRHYAIPDFGILCCLPVWRLAAKNSVLFMWSTWTSMPRAFELISYWGYIYKTCAFDWHKPQMGLGYWTRQDCEPCLLATRGKPKRLNANVRQGIIAPRREHSRKPDGIHERIERLVGGPYLELWARESTRPGWDFWGWEKEKFNEKDVALQSAARQG